jgi:hypothetical protein
MLFPGVLFILFYIFLSYFVFIIILFLLIPRQLCDGGFQDNCVFGICQPPAMLECQAATKPAPESNRPERSGHQRVRGPGDGLSARLQPFDHLHPTIRIVRVSHVAAWPLRARAAGLESDARTIEGAA